MAYISPAKVKEIRNNLKAAFPEIKFSVRGDNHTAIRVTILKSPYDFGMKGNYSDVNHYWLHESTLNHRDILEKIVQISNDGNYDESRPEIDYFSVGWYFTLKIGDWDRPYQMVA